MNLSYETSVNQIYLCTFNNGQLRIFNFQKKKQCLRSFKKLLNLKESFVELQGFAEQYGKLYLKYYGLLDYNIEFL